MKPTNVCYLVVACGALLACRPSDDTLPPPIVQVPVQAGGGGSGTGGSSGTAGPSADAGTSSDPPGVALGSWNLHNFSQYGTSEFRIADVAELIEELDLDVLAVQELERTDDGQGPQAWDVLLQQLPGYAGLHNPWKSSDTVVGLVYDTNTTSVLSSQPLFVDDSYAFPRAPLEAQLVVERAGARIQLRVIVLHLKAFADSVERRRDACHKLDSYLRTLPTDERVVLLGDLNDDPYDAPQDNAFVDSFLNAEPSYQFISQQLPPESVTSLGYYHWVDGAKIDGEFLDHAIVNQALADTYGTLSTSIRSVPPAARDDWKWDYSDHFPLLLTLQP